MTKSNVIYTDKFARDLPLKMRANPQESTSSPSLLREIFKGIGELGVMVAFFISAYIGFVFFVGMR